jgi:HTH-type transcriptional regulator/antitoxin HigA
MNTIADPNQINVGQYAELLALTLPKAIETEAENERALEIVNQLMTKGEKKLTAEEHVLLRMLVLLIEEFEKKAYPISRAEPHEVLKTLLENRDLQQVDLLPIFGARSNVSAVLAGKRPIGKGQAKALAEFFNVSTDLFI